MLSVHASRYAFAALLADGSVATWGNECSGGDSSQVQDRLRNVQGIQPAGTAFAAILADGSVATWGAQHGDSSKVQGQLRNVQVFQGTLRSFAVILADGSLVTWGKKRAGGESTKIRDQLAEL